MNPNWAQIVASMFQTIISDTLAAFGIPGASVGGEAISRLLKSRLERAREIFLEELKAGTHSPADPGEVDEFVAILYRYLQCAQEGAARLNLRLMASVINGMKVGKAIYAEEFLRYSHVISALSREEVIVLATRARFRRQVISEGIKEGAVPLEVGKRAHAALIPSTFPDEDHLVACYTALQRTGLIWPGGSTLGGGFVWVDTPLLEKFSLLADFENALASESDPK